MNIHDDKVFANLRNFSCLYIIIILIHIAVSFCVGDISEILDTKLFWTIQS